MAKPKSNYLDEALALSKKALRYVFIFSVASNIMILGLPLYSLQVMDRVQTSGSFETLLMLTLLTTGLIISYSLFQLVRSMTLIKMSKWLDDQLSEKLLRTSLSQASMVKGMNASQNLRDMSTVRNFLSGPGLSAIFDAPSAVILFLIIFIIHPLLCLVGLIGGVLLLFCGILNERATQAILSQANEESIRSFNFVDTSARNAEVIEAMGMSKAMVTKWQKDNKVVQGYQLLASERSAVVNSFARGIRMFLQIAIMGVGVALVLEHAITMGSVIACSILVGRALSPFETAIAAWSSVTGYRKSLDRLRKSIERAPERSEGMLLPTPEGNLSIEKVVYAIQGGAVILKGVNAEITAGEAVGIIGPSAAGKSTLAKLIVGVWKPTQGVVRLDSADVYTWNREQFGQFVGYLPQDVELFDGTVKQNIARMREEATDEDVIAAAQISGTHDMILRLPNGYDTQIGVGGTNLSAGQRQRIGLARAFYGNPKLIVLDEPNSNLDDSGESALIAAIKNARNLKITTIVIAHRPSVLNFVDKIMVMRDGAVADYGPAKEILSKYMRSSIPPEQSRQIQGAAQQQRPAGVNPAPGINPNSPPQPPQKPADETASGSNS